MTDNLRSRNPALVLADCMVERGLEVNWDEIYRLAAICEEEVYPAQEVIWGARRPTDDWFD
jgi:hypothetical protein